MHPAPLEADITPMQNWFEGDCRRKAPRFHFGLATLGYLLLPNETAPQQIWLIDISESGIGFFSNWNIDTGTEVELTMRGKAPLKVKAKVVYSFKDKAAWRVGCQFLAPLSPEILDTVL